MYEPTNMDPYAEVFDEGHDANRHGVHQRIRANSTIMKMKKILGTVLPLARGEGRRADAGA
jgi:hypothetical protein